MVKSTLEKEINTLMKKGYLATFKGSVYTDESTKQVKKMAQDFADAVAPKLADAIDKYIKSADLNITLAPTQTFTVTGLCAGRPVAGTAIGPLTGSIKAGLS